MNENKKNKKIKELEEKLRVKDKMNFISTMVVLFMLIIIFITSSPIESVKCPTDYSLSSDNSMCLSDFEGLQNPEIEPNRGLYLLDNISFGAFLFGLSIMMYWIVKMFID